MSTVNNTIRLSDTIDQFARRVHINVRNGKVTMVYRWKDSKSIKNHTQRITLTDEQAGRLAGLILGAADLATSTSKDRKKSFFKSFEESALFAATGSTDPL